MRRKSDRHRFLAGSYRESNITSHRRWRQIYYLMSAERVSTYARLTTGRGKTTGCPTYRAQLSLEALAFLPPAAVPGIGSVTSSYTQAWVT